MELEPCLLIWPHGAPGSSLASSLTLSCSSSFSALLFPSSPNREVEIGGPRGPAWIQLPHPGQAEGQGPLPKFPYKPMKDNFRKQHSKGTQCQSQGKQPGTQLPVQPGLGNVDSQRGKPREAEEGKRREVWRGSWEGGFGSSWLLLPLQWALEALKGTVKMRAEEVATRGCIWLGIDKRGIILTSKPFIKHSKCALHKAKDHGL